MRSPAGRLRHSFPRTRTSRSPRSAAPSAIARRPGSSAITGAAGKTTTKDILATLCARHRRTVASEGNFNNELGVPLTLGRIEPDTEVCIVEMGMRGLGQIAWLASFARPEIGLITNIAPVHLELVGTVENVARAKAELIEALPPGGTAVVPEEPLLEPYLTRTDIEIRRFGQPEEAGRFRVGDREIRLETTYAGPHQLQNTLAALTVCDVLGIPIEDGVLDVRFSPLREEVIELARRRDADQRLLQREPRVDAGRARASRRRSRASVARSPCSARWPSSATRPSTYHREIGEEVVRSGVEAIVAVGPLAAEYLVAAPGVEVVQVAAVEEAVDALRAVMRPGDVVLVKGSRSVGLEAVAAKLRPRWHTYSSQRSSRSSSRSSPARSSSTSCAATRSARRSARRGRSTTRSSRARRRWAAS